MAIDQLAPLLTAGPSMVAGDFNASAQTNRGGQHLRNVGLLDGLGLRSTYHVHSGLQHGHEADMTLRWAGPKAQRHEYHCDFVFASGDLLDRLISVEVGRMTDWVESGLSDHCPVITSLADTATRGAPS
jgi:endonuclease/exonuclease/phosphatase family metal-dependent hydrolase